MQNHQDDLNQIFWVAFNSPMCVIFHLKGHKVNEGSGLRSNKMKMSPNVIPADGENAAAEFQR